MINRVVGLCLLLIVGLFANQTVAQCAVCDDMNFMTRVDSSGFETNVIIYAPIGWFDNGCISSSAYAACTLYGYASSCAQCFGPEGESMLCPESRPFAFSDANSQVQLSCVSSAGAFLGSENIAGAATASLYSTDPPGYLEAVYLHTESGVTVGCAGPDRSGTSGITSLGLLASWAGASIWFPIPQSTQSAYAVVTIPNPTPPPCDGRLHWTVIRVNRHYFVIVEKCGHRKLLGDLADDGNGNLTGTTSIDPSEFGLNGNLGSSSFQYTIDNVDVNYDGRLTQGDVAAIYLLFGPSTDENGNPLSSAKFDFNGDGTVDAGDLEILQSLIDGGGNTGVFGDVNRDEDLCFLDQIDVDIFNHDYQIDSSSYDITLDKNLDGVLDSFDYFAYINEVVPLLRDPDYNQDGVADSGDVASLIDVFAGGNPPSTIDPDYNNDGVADGGDADWLINVIAGGGC